MNRPTSFALHIAPLFTEEQRDCMIKVRGFDLKSYDDVRKWANKIAQQVSTKSMPDDASNPWPDEWISLFQRWVAEGCLP